MGENMRIYIGGLGSDVHEDDLKKTFTSPQLGTVQSVEIIRSKGRSFGYLEFVPASDKGLSKLFSTYNGCMWKGGRLKLEKAREDYLSRLRREWTEDAEPGIKSSSQNVDANEIDHVLQKPKENQDIHKLQLNIFFPKLRKIKPIPLKGTGKHKYSFQRVEIPPLPIHFCDCEEHSGPPELAKRNIVDHHETRNIAYHHESDPCRVNEDELNMMKLILNKFLEEEATSKTVPSEAELSEKLNKDISYADNLQVDDSEEEEASDEDNLVINIVGQPSRRVASFEDWGQKTTPANQDFSVREPVSFDGPIPKIHGSNKQKFLPDKKRKQSIHENNSNDIIPSKKKSKKGGPPNSTDNPAAVNTQPTDTKFGSKPLSSEMPSSRKSAWKDLVIEKESTAFRISDILMDPNPDVEPKPRSGCLSPAPCSNENVDHKDQSGQDKELSNRSDVQSTKLSASEDKSARGSSWLQKSSWLQLVGGSDNNSAFNLSQILPGVTFQKQEEQQFGKNEFWNSRNGEQQRFDHKDKKSPIEGIGKPQGGADKDIYATLGNKNVDVLTKEQNRAGLDVEQPNFDPKQTVKEKDEVSAIIFRSSRAVPGIVISETCPFMKSAASMKEWMKSKAALSGFHKKHGAGPGLKKD